MRTFILIVIAPLLTFKLFAQAQVTITLIADSGVRHSTNLHFYITNGVSKTHNFTFTKFSKSGEYSNPNLLEYNENIDTGHFKINIALQTTTLQIVTDSLTIESFTARVEIFVYVSVKNSKSDYIREVNTIKYLTDSTHLAFNFIDKPQIGSKAVFQITNLSPLPLFGYPNPAFFLGTLYKEIGDDSWSQFYPLSIDHKYCNTNSDPMPLHKNETAKSWVPNEKDCSEYHFKESGNYYFELLFSDNMKPTIIVQEETKLKKQQVFREVFEFNL